MIELWDRTGRRRPGLVAELGQTGGSDVGAYVEAVHAFAEAGCVAVKVQMIDPEKLAAPGAAPYWQTSRYASDQAESFRIAGCVPHDGWGAVREACEQVGVGFVATPFDLTALDPLADLDPDGVKIASGDITWRALIQGAASRFSQVLLSTGASESVEVGAAMRWAAVARGQSEWGGHDGGVLPLACSLEYPCPPEHARLDRIRSLGEVARGRPVGYSDHTVQIELDDFYAWGFTLAALNVALVEKHCALQVQGGDVPDLDMAMNEWEAGYLVGGLLDGHEALGPVGDFGPHPDETPARVGARRSLRVARPLKEGHQLVAEDFVALRPCEEGWCPPDHLERLTGRTLAVDVGPGPVVDWVQQDGRIRMTTEEVTGGLPGGEDGADPVLPSGSPAAPAVQPGGGGA